MKKILIVDDSNVARMSLKSILEENNYAVFVCGNGMEAISAIKNETGIELIICDQNMPQMDGLTFCEVLRNDFGHLSIPVVMLTTEISLNLKEKAKALGVKAWIIKPFNEKQLVTGVRSILNK